MEAYSMDLRVRVLADSDAGMSTKGVAEKYRVCTSWVRRLKQRRRESGEIAPRKAGFRHESKWERHAERIREAIAEKSDLTLRELRDKLGGGVSVQTLSRALRQLGLTLKKSR
jgi:transposase